eukprot:gene13520-biopygen2294
MPRAKVFALASDAAHGGASKMIGRVGRAPWRSRQRGARPARAMPRHEGGDEARVARRGCTDQGAMASQSKNAERA